MAIEEGVGVADEPLGRLCTRIAPAGMGRRELAPCLGYCGLLCVRAADAVLLGNLVAHPPGAGPVFSPLLRCRFGGAQHCSRNGRTPSVMAIRGKALHGLPFPLEVLLQRHQLRISCTYTALILGEPCG